MNRYVRTQKLGEGTYGVVYKGTDTVTQTTVAIKKMKFDEQDEGVPCTTLREISVLKELRHPNIVTLLDVVYERTSLFIVFEYLDQDLKQYLDYAGTDLNKLLVKSYMHQLLTGMEYCHARRVMHRDLKPQNLLVDRQGRLKLADFGLARTHSLPIRTFTHEIVTLWYRAPEVLLGSRLYSTAVDVWSMGCIFCELITRTPLLRGDSEIDQLFRIFKLLGTPTEATWPGVKSLSNFKMTFPQWGPMTLAVIPALQEDPLALDLVHQMLVCDPSRRISAREALKHPYFDELNKLHVQQNNARALQESAGQNGNATAADPLASLVHDMQEKINKATAKAKSLEADKQIKAPPNKAFLSVTAPQDAVTMTNASIPRSEADPSNLCALVLATPAKSLPTAQTMYAPVARHNAHQISQNMVRFE
jgi:serine/threonine protein kinase